jgi:hypothetical protein
MEPIATVVCGAGPLSNEERCEVTVRREPPMDCRASMADISELSTGLTVDNFTLEAARGAGATREESKEARKIREQRERQARSRWGL